MGETPKAISDEEVQPGEDESGIPGEEAKDDEIKKLWDEVDEDEIDKKPEPEKKKRGRPPKKTEVETEEKEEETEPEKEKGKEEKKEEVEEPKPKTAKERIEEKQKEVEEVEKKEEAAKEKIAAQPKEVVKSDLLFDLSKTLESLPLTEEDKEFIKDFPESIKIMGAAQNAQTKQTYDEFNRVITDIVSAVDNQLANLRNRVVINEIVPDWQSLINDPEKKDKEGNSLISPKFESWLKKQTPFYQKQFESGNPYDCADVIVAYKEHLAEEKVTESDRKKQEQLEKDKKKYGSSPKARKSSIPGGTEGKTISELWAEVPEPD